MLVTESGILIDVKPWQLANAPYPMLVTESEIVTEVKELQANADFPMRVTEFGIVIDVKPVYENAEFPMLVTEFGIVIEVNNTQVSNAEFPIFVTLSGIVTEVKPKFSLNALPPISVTGFPSYTEGITTARVLPLNLLTEYDFLSLVSANSNLGSIASIEQPQFGQHFAKDENSFPHSGHLIRAISFSFSAEAEFYCLLGRRDNIRTIFRNRNHRTFFWASATK